MKNPFKTSPWPRLVRVQHKDMQEHAIEGIALGIVDGHYWLTAARMIAAANKTVFIGDLFVPTAKVLFLESIAADAS